MPSFHKISTASTDDDQSLVNRFKGSRDLAVLGELYGRYMDLVYGVCYKYLRDTESSKDAVMELFEEIGEKLMKHEVTSFRSWLYTVVKNHCLMKLRSAQRNKLETLDENVQLKEELHQDEIKEKEWQMQQMRKCIDLLGEEQKRIVELFYLQERCYKEIADITGLDWNKVRSLIQNGRRNLKICMDKSLSSTFSQNE